jgi:YTH domain-containing family protein
MNRTFTRYNLHFLIIFQSLIFKAWSSTKEGNTRLNEIYEDSCRNNFYPIYLFFSLNQSGQFCGVAQL